MTSSTASTKCFFKTAVLRKKAQRRDLKIGKRRPINNVCFDESVYIRASALHQSKHHDRLKMPIGVKRLKANCHSNFTDDSQACTGCSQVANGGIFCRTVCMGERVKDCSFEHVRLLFCASRCLVFTSPSKPDGNSDGSNASPGLHPRRAFAAVKTQVHQHARLSDLVSHGCASTTKARSMKARCIPPLAPGEQVGRRT